MFAGSKSAHLGRPGRAGAATVGRVAGGTARYDEIADFYDATAGKSVTDAATAALLAGGGWFVFSLLHPCFPLYLVARCWRP